MDAWLVPRVVQDRRLAIVTEDVPEPKVFPPSLPALLPLPPQRVSIEARGPNGLRRRRRLLSRSSFIITIDVGRNMLRLGLALGKECPPKSTLFGWLAAPTRAVGRPRLLSNPEEEELLACMELGRSRGLVLDQETVRMMGTRVQQRMRPEDAVVGLSDDWVTSLKWRHKVSNQRSVTTDRPPCTPAERETQNEWPAQLQEVAANVRAFGCAVDSFDHTQLLAMDETPLQYVPKTQGTFQLAQETPRSCYVANRRDKRQATASPVVTRSGEVVVLQIIWRSTSNRCHPGSATPLIFQTHSKMNMQVCFPS